MTLLEQVGQEVNSARIAVPIAPVARARGRRGHRALFNITCALELRRGGLGVAVWALGGASAQSGRRNF